MFCVQTYPRIGKVVGRFYDESGQPTAALAEVHRKAEEGKQLQVGAAQLHSCTAAGSTRAVH